MGMFDLVRFPYRMPDGTLLEGAEYQTKDLRYAMDMATYEVTPQGRLIRVSSDFNQPLIDLNFGYTLCIHGAGGYELRFVDGVLQDIHCFQSGKTVPFNPN